MARKPRLHVPGGLYHVISRGNNRQNIFEKARDRTVFLDVLGDTVRRMEVTLYAYVLMTNHVHLLVQVADLPLSEFMRRLLIRYTQGFNRRYGRVGHLFQGRYKAILCQKETYLKELVRYIHLNPVRARLVKRPANYAWSSHGVYLGTRREPFVSASLVLGLFGRSRLQSRRAYGRFVQEGMGEGHRPELYRAVEGRYLGPDEFLEAVKVQEKRLSQRLSRRRWPTVRLEEMAESTAAAHRVSVQAMRSARRIPPLPLARAQLCYHAVVDHGFKVSDLARWLRCDPSAVTHAIRRLEEKNVTIQN